VRVADREWPISLDLASGGLLLHLSVHRYLLRPLTWGAKRKLARFAHLGDQFVRRHLALACATPPVWPDDVAEAEALMLAAAAVSAFADDTLAFSAGALLRVSLEVSRETGVTLDALDEQAAVDVEALWRMIADTPREQPAANREPPQARPFRSESSVEPPSEPGWNRIVVLPDPVPIAAKETVNKAAPSPATPMPEAAPVDNQPSSELVAPAALSPEQMIPPPGFAAAPSPQTIESPNQAAPEREREQTFSRLKRDEKRFRVTWSAVPAALPAVPSARLVAETKSVDDSPVRAAPADDSWISAHGLAPAQFQPIPASEPSADEQSEWPDSAGAELIQADAPAARLRDAAQATAPSHEPLLPRRMPIAASESIFEGFADELESAAETAGIDLEG